MKQKKKDVEEVEKKMELKKRACGVSRQYWSQIKMVLPLIFFLFMKRCYNLN